jgi:hypothetical protein
MDRRPPLPRHRRPDPLPAPIITIKDRKITHWRDYLDPVAIFDATNWPSRNG